MRKICFLILCFLALGWIESQERQRCVPGEIVVKGELCQAKKIIKKEKLNIEKIDSLDCDIYRIRLAEKKAGP